MTALLLCCEAYEIGRKDGGMCFSRETIITLLVVTITNRPARRLSGFVHVIVKSPLSDVFMRGNGG